MTRVRLSLIIGVQHAQANIPEIKRALRQAAHRKVERRMLVTISDDPTQSRQLLARQAQRHWRTRDGKHAERIQLSVRDLSADERHNASEYL
jgi:hypothetical protein